MTQERPGMDSLDLALLAEIQHDGRATYEALSRPLGLSRPAVRARLHRLLESEVVRIVGVVHPSVFGLTAYAHTAISVDGPVEPVAARVAASPQAPFVSAVAGRRPLVAELRSADQASLAAAVRDLAAIPGVRCVDTALYTEILKDTHFPPRPYSPTTIDELDRGLLAELQRDGRASFADLGVAVGLSTSAARSRVLRLLESGAVHIGARVHPGALGSAQPVGFELTFAGHATEAVERIRGMEKVQFFATALGRCDAIGTAVGHSPEEVLAVLDEIRGTPGVRSAEAWTHLRVVKESYDA
ncbi:Lrp/AsnC family transcriptional regulator [Spirillospora sp. NPDC047279]|uniref:Lrp/AsnC family transcriptional regulator n=1 Tax=Spirillospora sp. NPDC047279 TaxID=3155478 RepID=UPI0033F33F75